VVHPYTERVTVPDEALNDPENLIGLEFFNTQHDGEFISVLLGISRVPTLADNEVIGIRERHTI
jgi:hypothetical protein